MRASLTEDLLNWYGQNARELPWRGQSDPYAVWVSEVMLQQTRIDTVIPYYRRWMSELPTVASLAGASQQAVLGLWEGLGYYSRARNLHSAARVIVEKHGGNLPGDMESLLALPGIGPYTAAAIASIAFGQDEPVVDGNVRRVLSRVFNIPHPAGSSQSECTLKTLTRDHLPSGRAGEYNQALMDLGAMVCTPKKPACTICPISMDCQANHLGNQEDRPVRKLMKPIPHHTVTAAVIFRDRKVLIGKRPERGLLGGLWEFPGGKQEPGEDLASCLQREICEELGLTIHVGEGLGVFNHAYTHFKVTLHAFLCEMNGGEPEVREHAAVKWVRVDELSGFPMGKLDRQIAARLKEFG